MGHRFSPWSGSWDPTCWRAQPKNVCVSMLVAQSCLTLCNPMDCSLPVSSVHGILQARILEWVAIPFSRESSWTMDQIRVFPALETASLPSQPAGKPLPKNKNNNSVTQKLEEKIRKELREMNKDRWAEVLTWPHASPDCRSDWDDVRLLLMKVPNLYQVFSDLCTVWF